jgi:CBS domain-containing protein
LKWQAAPVAAKKEVIKMKVKEIMKENPAFATLNTSLHNVAQMMMDNDCGCIPIVENRDSRKPLGVITDRDITLRTVAHNKNPLTMVAGEIMTDRPATVLPETDVDECVTMMERNQIRRIVVVDEAGDLVGMVAQADIARQAPPLETAELVKDISTAA